MGENPELYTWSDITAYWQCPRAWAYGRLGWQPLQLPDALVAGSIVHEIVKAHDTRYSEDSIGTKGEQWDRLYPEAVDLAERYLQKYPDLVVDSADTLVSFTGTSLPGKAIGGHPDRLGWDKGKRVLVELKTGRSPDITALDMTGQRDFYSLIVEEAKLGQVALVYLDIVSPEYITRVERPPRRSAAEYILYELMVLQSVTLKEALEAPRFSWRCSSCWFYKACSAREQGGSDRAILEAQFVQKEPRQ